MLSRFAGSAPVQALKNWRVAGLPAGLSRMLGLGTIGAVAAAGSQLLTPDQSPASNLGGLVGAGIGAYPGAALGGIAGDLIGGGGLGSRIGRPLGGLVGAVVGGGMGKDAGSGAARQLTGENIDPMVKQARTLMQLEAERAKAMLPITAQQAQMAIEAEMNRARQLAALENDRLAQQALASAILNGQNNGAALQAQLISGVLG